MATDHSSSESRRLARIQARNRQDGRVITATVVQPIADTNLIEVLTLGGSRVRCRSICNRVLQPGDNVQVTVGRGQQLPLIDGIPV